MDIISGLSRVMCYAIKEEDEGKTVSITNGSNTWSTTLVGGKASFLIPSIPVPARVVYTVTMEDEFTKDIQMGYGDIIEVYLDDSYDVVLHKDLDAFKEETEETLSHLTDNLTFKTDDSAFEFKVGVDANGRCGYYKAGADSVTPFRTGQETFCYSLGAGRSFDIKAACNTIRDVHGIDIDYSELTAANFVVQPTSGGWSGEGNVTHENVGETTQYLHVNSEYSAPTISYAAATGMLTVGGSTYRGSCYLSGPSTGTGGSHYSNTATTSVKAYLIKQMN